MAAYERVTLNRGGRNSRFDCISVMTIFHCWVCYAFNRIQFNSTLSKFFSVLHLTDCFI